MKRFPLDNTESDSDEINDYMRCLGVSETSGSVEQMFSIAGRIFQSKRRRMLGKIRFLIQIKNYLSFKANINMNTFV